MLNRASSQWSVWTSQSRAHYHIYSKWRFYSTVEVQHTTLQVIHIWEWFAYQARQPKAQPAIHSKILLHTVYSLWFMSSHVNITLTLIYFSVSNRSASAWFIFLLMGFKYMPRGSSTQHKINSTINQTSSSTYCVFCVHILPPTVKCPAVALNGFCIFRSVIGHQIIKLEIH